MRIIVENIKIPAFAPDDEAIAEALARIKRCRGLGEARSLSIYRRSVDARRRDDVKLVCSVAAEVTASRADEAALAAHGIKILRERALDFARGTEKLRARPVIAGFGPAGMFCALALAENGYAPIVLERGSDLDGRVRAVEAFYATGELDERSNIQFGAGGAGAFSDGKLTTRIGDGRCGYVLRRLVSLGAPEEILVRAKPHIGTDKLRTVVAAADAAVRRNGGEIRYLSRVSGINAGSVKVESPDGESSLPYGALVLATGHSARDIYEHLLADGWRVEPKAYSVGVRIEHLRADIDEALYGRFCADPRVGHAEYAMSTHRGGRGVYTFCMCPGGEVVAAASERGGVVVNGMSRFARDGVNSNAAVAVTVQPDDYGATPYAAMDFRREIERAAYASDGRRAFDAPVQTVGDFLAGRCATEPNRIAPSYMGGGRYVLRDLNTLLPAFVCDALKIGLADFGRALRGFDAPDVPLTAPETRTSSPVRIVRGDTYEAEGRERVYPCGEGAGYAGGIMSAAVDGLRVAEAIMARYAPFEG
jgi:uncharacterized FAD-dependent dehydrogenase